MAFPSLKMEQNRKDRIAHLRSLAPWPRCHSSLSTSLIQE